MKPALQTLLVILVLTLGGAALTVLVFTKPTPEQVESERPVTTVEVIEARPTDTRLRVESHGTVLPRTEGDLAAEVGGRILNVSPNFRPGGYFKKDDVLVRIDPADYRAAVAARKADLASARLGLEQERALAEQAESDWKALGKGEPSPLTLRKPQLEEARAAVESAEAALDRAERDLARTQVRAPYDGRVLEQRADVGTYVNAAPSSVLARIYAIDTAEVRLPITDRQAGFIDLPIGGEVETGSREALPRVTLRGSIGGKEHAWEGHIVRSEATIDDRSRLLFAVAEIRQPFKGGDERPPIQRGLFADAAIEGRKLENVFALPRYALRGSDTIYVVDAQNTLHAREVGIVQATGERVVIDNGLQAGDLIATSPIAFFVEGMPVKIKSEPDEDNAAPGSDPEPDNTEAAE